HGRSKIIISEDRERKPLLLFQFNKSKGPIVFLSWIGRGMVLSAGSCHLNSKSHNSLVAGFTYVTSLVMHKEVVRSGL
ncbi:hypothetical protein VIGAN_04200600, partial [Vigna angularis var. angularis]